MDSIHTLEEAIAGDWGCSGFDTTRAGQPQARLMGLVCRGLVSGDNYLTKDDDVEGGREGGKLGEGKSGLTREAQQQQGVTVVADEK